MENNFKGSKRPESKIFAGLILVCIGAALMLRNTGFPLPHWLFSWPVILIIVGLYSGIKHNFQNNSWIILMGIGGFFLFDRFIPGLSLAPYFWPGVIIAVGVLFILRPNRTKWLYNDFGTKKKEPDYSTGSWQKTNPDYAASDNSEFINVSSIFSGVQRNVMSKNFEGGKITCVFGGADIDLTQADINGKVIIQMDVVFGGVKLIVPPHWIIYSEVDGMFHGVDDKRKFNTSATANPEKILVLKGTVLFAGVDIKSY